MKKHIPNIITLIRMILIPIFVALYNSEWEYSLYAATAVFVLAAFSDMLDGYIARKNNLVSKIGQLIDPLADKLMYVTVLLCLNFRGVVPLWVLVIYLAKEVIMIVLASVLVTSEQQVIPSRWYGKLATALFFVAIVISIPRSDPPDIWLKLIFLVAISVAIYAFVRYGIIYIKYYMEKNRQVTDENKENSTGENAQDNPETCKDEKELDE